MSFRFRVVPKRKRRGYRKANAREASTAQAVGRDWLDGSTRGKGLGDLPRQVYQALDAISSQRTYSKGAILFVQGQKPEGVCIIAKGQVKLSACSADGKSLIIGNAEPGNVLGLPSVVSGKANELGAEALSPVQCSFISREAFVRFLRKHGVAALRVAEIVSEMYDAAFEQARYLGLSSTATEKLARLILDLPGVESETTDTKSFSATHKEVGEMIGTSRETVTRLFARFKRDQLVHVYDSHLCILDRQGLEQMLVG